MPKSFLRFSKASGSTKQKIERIVRQRQRPERPDIVAVDHSWNDAEHLCVKELAAAIQVGTHFVYQMRACGFTMHGPNGRRGNRTATAAEAARWIKENEFRLVNGRGVAKTAISRHLGRD